MIRVRNTKIPTAIAVASLAVLGSVSLHGQANEIELSISDDMIDLRLRADYEQDFFGRFAYLHADVDGIDTDQLSYTFATQGKMDRADVMLGLRPFWIDAESETGYGAALGIGASIPLVDKLSASAELFYSPEIITGGDIEDSLDVELRLSYQLIENGALFVGYRELEVDTDIGDFDIYDDFFLGVKLRF